MFVAVITFAGPYSSRNCAPSSSSKNACTVSTPSSIAIFATLVASTPSTRIPCCAKPSRSVPSFEPMSTTSESGSTEARAITVSAVACRFRRSEAVMPLRYG